MSLAVIRSLNSSNKGSQDNESLGMRKKKKKDGLNKTKYHLLGTCYMLGTCQKFSPVLTQLSEAQALTPTFQMKKLRLKRLVTCPGAYSQEVIERFKF